MKSPMLLSGIFLLAVAASSHEAPRDLEARVVLVVDNDIFISSGLTAEPRRITHDGGEKYLPVWSKDGSRIAYVAAVDRELALGNLVVVDGDGRVVDSIVFRKDEDALGGMRFIESLEWVGPDKLAISGSVNPSLTETVVVDLKTHTDQGGIFDDGPGADFSPTGRYFAYASGSPHFTPDHLRSPRLRINHEDVLPKGRLYTRLLGARRWSPDGTRLAVLAEDAAKRRHALVWNAVAGVSDISLPASASSSDDLFWSGAELFIVLGDGRALHLSPGTRSSTGISNSLEDPLKEAQSERGRLMNIIIERYDVQNADIWCEACALTLLPRRVSVNDN